MNTDNIEKLVVELSNDPFNESLNFKVAEEYLSLNQTASAVSFYLRTAEYGTTREYAYVSLLKMAKCFETQNDRVHTVSNCIFQAVTVLPERPEAYFYLAQFYERQRQWQECYSMACIGLNAVKDSHPVLPGTTDYLGEYCLEFEKAVAGWWLGRREESIVIFKKLERTPHITEEYLASIKRNLEQIGATV